MDATWKEASGKSGDRYIRRHWYEIVATDGSRMKIYFERNPAPSQRRIRRRWWLYTIAPPARSGPSPEG